MVRHTLILLFTTSATQVAGVAYAQPGERRISHVAALSVAALANVRFTCHYIFILYHVNLTLNRLMGFLNCL